MICLGSENDWQGIVNLASGSVQKLSGMWLDKRWYWL